MNIPLGSINQFGADNFINPGHAFYQSCKKSTVYALLALNTLKYIAANEHNAFYEFKNKY